VPKIDDYGSYLYLVIHAVYDGEQAVDLVSDELDIFLGSNFLITVHKRPMQSVERLWQEDFHQQDGLAKGPALLLYTLLDLQAGQIVRQLERFEAELERLGDVIFQRNRIADEELLGQILTAQSSTLRLHRVLSPQRDLMKRLSHADYKVIPTQTRVYFSDITDHLIRMVGMVEDMLELSRSTVDIYLALSNNRMNEIIKVLTIIATIFMPLSFLAGVYGMNFHYMPELEIPWAYPVVWLVFISVALGLLRLFRSWRWL
jgi:magnesium transporter